jgi:hypothetical protein
MAPITKICLAALAAAFMSVNALAVPRALTQSEISQLSPTNILHKVHDKTTATFASVKDKLDLSSRALSDDVVLNQVGWYPLADAVVSGDKGLVGSRLAQNLGTMLYYGSTDTAAENAELEKKIKTLVLSIPKTTPLKRVQEQLAYLARQIIGSGRAKDVTKTLNTLTPIFASGGKVPAN